MADMCVVLVESSVSRFLAFVLGRLGESQSTPTITFPGGTCSTQEWRVQFRLYPPLRKIPYRPTVSPPVLAKPDTPLGHRTSPPPPGPSPR